LQEKANFAWLEYEDEGGWSSITVSRGAPAKLFWTSNDEFSSIPPDEVGSMISPQAIIKENPSINPKTPANLNKVLIASLLAGRNFQSDQIFTTDVYS
jgi:hypothetical protein